MSPGLAWIGNATRASPAWITANCEADPDDERDKTERSAEDELNINLAAARRVRRAARQAEQQRRTDAGKARAKKST